MSRPDRLADVRAIFVDESRGLLAELLRDLTRLSQVPEDVEARARLVRPPHTIASTAGMLGARRLFEFANLVERAAKRLHDPSVALEPAMLAALDDAVVVMQAMIDRLAEGDVELQAAAMVAADLRSAFVLPGAARLTVVTG